ncbi:hypothetical protein [Heyndrickxia acidicola]|uniref:Uncharacterized protein n=1 Tax=Heyndrickxia acidicola TaxID=209389 RepID=A0ABU6MB02_9BACI|nr:hypothetical protein [Heyndrickxia acidicola]MED1201680.1 hypothetical protein [Heyndrickxia acidicola]
MKLIVYKKDIEYFLNNFLDIATYDKQGNKHYFVFQDYIRAGNWTLMHYVTKAKWTIHGKGSAYCDDNEVELKGQELIRFLYKNRKYINNELRTKKDVIKS